jgi:Malate synthase, TIM barrel domain
MRGLDQSITTSLTRSVVLVGPTVPEFEHLLGEDALEFLAALMRQVRPALAAVYGHKDGPSQRAVPAEFTASARELNRFDPQVEVDGLPISAGVFDFGLFVYHNAGHLLPRGSAPYFQLPKFDSPRDAQAWTDVFVAAQDALGLPRGSVRAKVRRT